MDGSKAHGGQEPAPDVPTPPTTRRPLPGAGPGAPRVEALDALLREIDGMRTALETDLTLAAGAVEAGAPGLAASLLDGDRADLASFEERALGHLAALEAADAPAPARAAAAAVPVPAEVRALRDRPARRSRLTRLLPAAPLVAAAAALVGLLGGVPQGLGRQAPADTAGAALSSWEELERLTATDAPPREVREAARDLNAEIAAMLVRADGDPAAARRALALLRDAQAVLANDDDADQLQGVLQQSRALAARLLATLPAAVRRGSAVPATGSTPLVRVPAVVPTAARSARPAPRPAQQAPQQEQPTRPAPTATPSTARPSASPSPSAASSRPAPAVLPSPLVDPF